MSSHLIKIRTLKKRSLLVLTFSCLRAQEMGKVESCHPTTFVFSKQKEGLCSYLVLPHFQIQARLGNFCLDFLILTRPVAFSVSIANLQATSNQGEGGAEVGRAVWLCPLTHSLAFPLSNFTFVAFFFH